MSDDVHRFWEAQAAAHAGSPAATTNDVYLRELEAATLIARLQALALPPGARVLDAGCGDGWTTLKVARACPGLVFHGVDYSAGMVAQARARLQPGDAVTFEEGDVLALAATGFDAAITDRCLINLTSEADQAAAIARIAAALRPGGHYLAIENFLEGQAELTRARAAVGLGEIPVRWHNRFFTEPGFRAAVAPHFALLAIEDFSSAYYFATRVVYAGMCRMRGEEPRYDHEIHRLAVDLPWTGGFSPIKLARLRRKEA